MAKFELKFLCATGDGSNIDVRKLEEDNLIEINSFDPNSGFYTTIHLDKSTAIKLSKTIRTEINKITESEGNNG